MEFFKRILGIDRSGGEANVVGNSNQKKSQLPQGPTSVVDSYIEKLPEGDKYFGFENETNTMCYANSAIQVLFHCRLFRARLLAC